MKHPVLTLQTIPRNTHLKYAICLTCVNREEKGIQNIIDKTFESFENGGMFSSKIDFEILLFESGSKSIDYLHFIEDYKNKYPNLKIKIIENSFPLDGYTNTHRMFVYLSKLENKPYDFIIWMDDDVWVCKKFLENTDLFVKKYGNFSIFLSLYVPFISFPMKESILCHYAYIYNYFGSCCTIFKPELTKFILPHFFNKHGKPDSKFRRSVEHFFPNCYKIIVSSVSLVQHMNAGTVNHMGNKGYKGHRAKNFVGINRDPQFRRYI